MDQKSHSSLGTSELKILRKLISWATSLYCQFIFWMCPPTGILHTCKCEKSKSFLNAFFYVVFPTPRKKISYFVQVASSTFTAQNTPIEILSLFQSQRRAVEDLRTMGSLLCDALALSVRFLVISILVRYQSLLNVNPGANFSEYKFSIVCENRLQTWMSFPSHQGENNNNYYKERNLLSLQ